MDTFTVENCKQFCGVTSDCMSFEAKFQQYCRIAFKSQNTGRVGHAPENNKIYEKSTDCYVKLAEDPAHKDYSDYFEILDSSCIEENEAGEQVEIEGYRMTEYFDGINNSENCMAGCVV